MVYATKGVYRFSLIWMVTLDFFFFLEVLSESSPWVGHSRKVLDCNFVTTLPFVICGIAIGCQEGNLLLATP